ncbi:hypothetical protein L2E82_51298 [Cichorium intybus]|nr:hypothetical protein L2E82_51298 [Cichorium intybus]
MDHNILNDYHQFQLLNASCNDTATVYLSKLWMLVYNSDQQARYSKPMPWIGMYIALASLYCVFAMVADLLHGLRNRRLWFPCKYFTLNAASVTVIAIAIKLPMDLTNLMPGYVDQAAKLGSLGFMCTIMANLLPSLATMNSKELFTNVIALGVFVITLVVDVCIQINTGILAYYATEDFNDIPHKNLIPLQAYVRHQRFIAISYVGLLLLLLTIYACSSLAILKSKEILESNYQAAHETALKDREPARLGIVWELQQRVSDYWTMAGTGSPQFMTACSVTTSASGGICALSTAGSSSIMSAQNDERVEQNKDRRRYVLRLQDDKEFAERTLRSISESVGRLIQKAGRKQPENLLKLLAKSRPCFEGVDNFDSDHVPPLLSEEYLHCWSLPLVTLTIIAMSLPNIQKDILDCMLSGVSEGLAYVSLVEETLNAIDGHVGIQKVAQTLWQEVEPNQKWLGKKLPKTAPQLNTAGQILQWLSNKAERNYLRCDNSEYMSISANSMYRITKTIMLSYHQKEKLDTLSQDELFGELSSMIADILAACLTNLPQVIIMKCHTTAIEKREASVHVAAQLLGETTLIINSLHVRGPPRLNPDELAFIDKWRAYFKHPFP